VKVFPVLYQGQTLRVTRIDHDFVELSFDSQRGVNRLDAATAQELRTAVSTIAIADRVRGVLVTSGQSAFMAGADAAEYAALLRRPQAEIETAARQMSESLRALEELKRPVAVALNGAAIDGGLELALAADFRVMSATAQAGLTQVRWGLSPHLGGTARLPRLIEVGSALDWLTGGKLFSAGAARSAGVVDDVVDAATVRNHALDWLTRAAGSELDWQARRRTKEAAVNRSSAEIDELCRTKGAEVARSSPRHQPAAAAAIECVRRSSQVDLPAALKLEQREFAALAKTQAADSLVQAACNEVTLKARSSKRALLARKVQQSSVVGAGIMGGGIAYASALAGTPILMKDIAQRQLTRGIEEVDQLLARQVSAGRLTVEGSQAVRARITPQLDYIGFGQVDLVIEAVVENLTVKHAVLGEIEKAVSADAIVATNTSSLRVDDLATPLARPEQFVGLHFFNPVPMMPLVEVIQGSRTSETAVATAVGYALALGKTPIVVKDCPGFLVNRLLTAYLLGFAGLVFDGADFVKVDRAMEAFGWPMGPAYLADVIGLDTMSHIIDIICAGYPQRMITTPLEPAKVMAARQRYGQKSGVGFYRYETDPNGKRRKVPQPDSYQLLAPSQRNGARDFSEAEIVERMMLPMVLEAAVALEEGVVESAAALDTAMSLGLGFPKYAGGPLKYADWLGLDQVVDLSTRYARIGPLYRASDALRGMAARSGRFYS
jgi:3-hydroxyacyl-CoA dehydrogenase/enoyl-CoA hydratase/3-hydroxybutyryl-CoA epimerase/enoyl-CoA isomerase